MIRTVVMLVAGLGTRLYPLTRTVPKEMMLVYDRPLIQRAVDEAAKAGFRRIFIVHSNAIVDRYFRDPGGGQDGFGGPIEEPGPSLDHGLDLRFVRMPIAAGRNGSAIALLSVEECLGNEERFAVVLPDDVVMPPDESWSRLLAQSAEDGAMYMLLTEVAIEKHRWGMVQADELENGLKRIRALVEKPRADEASNYRYGIIGRYILPRTIFAAIRRTPPDVRGELNLTDAMRTLARDAPCYGVTCAGAFFDAGTFDGLVRLSQAAMAVAQRKGEGPRIEEVRVVPGRRSRTISDDDGTRYLKGAPESETLVALCIAGGNGCYVHDADGNTFHDFSFGLNVPLGHGHIKVATAVYDAMLSVVNTGNYATLGRARLSERLQSILLQRYTAWQFYSAGTESVEAALRYARAITGRHGFISFEGSYHGRTTGSVSLAEMRAWNGPRMGGCIRVPFADAYRWPDWKARLGAAIDTISAADRQRIAAVVVEPIQGERVVVPPPQFLRLLRTLCDTHGWLLIADEVLTGLGRTGHALASSAAGIDPDIVCLGKCLGNGYPISAVAVRDRYAPLLAPLLGTTTFGGNPVACAAALATLEAYETERVWENVREVGERFVAALDRLRESRHVGDLRGRGMLAGIEFVKDPSSKEVDRETCRRVAEELLRRGVLVTSLNNVIRLTPPLTTTAAQVLKVADIVVRTIRDLAG
jgi:4-aminobutyrate aminotransferase-like enzyme/UTP-glucose-1-phosphate uridylyltransferase